MYLSGTVRDTILELLNIKGRRCLKCSLVQISLLTDESLKNKVIGLNDNSR